MIAITGATGQLGHLVIEQLLKTVPASQIVAIVRNPAKAQALSQQGIVVRQADYTDEAAFTAALSGVDKLLLISSSEVGQRATQHQNVINAACCATAGIPKTTWRARRLRWNTACLLVRQAKAKLPLPPAQTMPRRQPK